MFHCTGIKQEDETGFGRRELKRKGCLPLCPRSEFLGQDVHRWMLQRGLKLRTEGLHFLFREIVSLANQMPTFSNHFPTLLPTPTNHPLGCGEEATENDHFIGQIWIFQSYKVWGCWEKLSGQKKILRMRTKDQRRAGSADSRDAGSRYRWWKAWGWWHLHQCQCGQKTVMPGCLLTATG